ncbi:MAG: DUF4433 domain-containing protein [Phormidium sp.]
MSYTEFYDNLSALEFAIDWNIMEDNYWANTSEDGDRKRRRQAEFLVYQFCPWRLIEKIGVIDRSIKLQVEQILENINHQPDIEVYSNWYY